MAASITFKSATKGDRALLRGWLDSPHVKEWWGDPEQEIECIAYSKDIDGTEGFIILLDDKPVGYIQSWVPSQFDNEGWEKDLAADVRGIDIFIGEISALGSGADIIRAFSRQLFAGGNHHLVIDPDKRNYRAIRAYEKAGFTKFGEPENSILMELKGK